MAVYPTPERPANATLESLDGTRDQATGIPYPARATQGDDLERDWSEMALRMRDIFAEACECQAVKVSDTAVGVFPGNYTQGGTQKTYAGTTSFSVTLTDNTYYLYLDTSGVLTESTTQPTGDEYLLASYVVSGAVIASITDLRGYARATAGGVGVPAQIGDPVMIGAGGPKLSNNAGEIKTLDNAETGQATIDCAAVKVGGTTAINSSAEATKVAAPVEVGTGGVKLKDSSGTLEVRNNADTDQAALDADEIKVAGATAINTSGEAVKTTSPIQVGTGGPKLKNNAGTLEVRDSTDTDYAPLEVDELKVAGATAIDTSGQAVKVGSPLELGSGGVKLKSNAGVLEARTNADDDFATMEVDALRVAGALAIDNDGAALKTGSPLEIGAGGVKLKDNAGTLEARNNADTDYAPMEVDELKVAGVTAINQAGEAVTTASPLEIGAGGPIVKNSAGVASFRDNADAVDATVKCGSLMVGTNEAIDSSGKATAVVADAIGQSEIEANGVDFDELTTAVKDYLIYVTVAPGSETSDQIDSLIEVYSEAGQTIGETVLRIWLSDTPSGGVTGTTPSGGVSWSLGTQLKVETAGRHYLVVTNSSGQCRMVVTHSGAKTWYICAAVVGEIDSAGITFT